MSKAMKIHNEDSVEGMYAAGRITALALDVAENFIAQNPHCSTLEIENHCRNFIESQKAFPECIGYQVGSETYHHATCTSVNDVVCHGVPSASTKLKDGDIINVDLVVRYSKDHDLSTGTHDRTEVMEYSWLGDSSRTILIGNVSGLDAKLAQVAKEAMYAGIKAVRKGVPFKNIGFAISQYCRNQHFQGTRFSVVSGFCGHGISRFMHEKPSVEHTRNNCEVPMSPYQYFTIEPIVMIGHNTEMDMDDDGWTVRSKSGMKSTQWEHTLGVDDMGHIMIFTTRDLDHEYQVLKEIFGSDADRFFRNKRS